MPSYNAASHAARRTSHKVVEWPKRAVTRFGPMVLRRRLPVLVTVFVLLVGCAGAPAASPPVSPTDGTPGEVRISGDVYTPMTVTIDTLQSFQHQTHPVTFDTNAGTQRHVYTGATLESLLSTASPRGVDRKSHPFLTIAIVATGADGYAATLTWTDVVSEQKSSPVLVAWSEDDTPLGQPRLVVPGDRNGARFVKDLIELRVVQLGSPSSSLRENYHRGRHRGTATG
jgi:DMSO/TMAO reductase YedYZ molybdopterin-dependent catalytic subunit